MKHPLMNWLLGREEEKKSGQEMYLPHGFTYTPYCSNSVSVDVSGKIYDIPDLMGKRITGVGHKPWRDWNEAEPVLIADGELVRVTYEAYVAVNFQHCNNALWPRTWREGHCIWHVESRLFDIFEYDSRFTPERFNPTT